MVDTIVNLQFSGNDLYNTDGSLYGTFSGNLVIDYTSASVTGGSITVSPGNGSSYSFSAAAFLYYASTPEFVASGGFGFNLIAGSNGVEYSSGSVTTTYPDGNFQIFYDSQNPSLVGVTNISPGSTQTVTTSNPSVTTRTGNFTASNSDWYAGTGSYSTLIDESVTPTVISGVPCFAAGTRIRTERGDIPVEALALGDRVVTANGEPLPIRWIGHRLVHCLCHPQPAKVLPVRIRAHALALNRPSRDLLLSPDHAIFAEGVLIPIKYLINGHSVSQVEVDRVIYFHIELPVHAIVIADGLAAESYLDTGDRGSFDDTGPLRLHPAFNSELQDISLVMDARGCAPLMVVGAEVDRVKNALASQQSGEKAATSQPALRTGKRGGRLGRDTISVSIGGSSAG
jgi:hypothetical protein